MRSSCQDTAMTDPKAKPARKLKSNSDLKTSNSNVVQQAKLMDSAGTAWHAVKYGNLEVCCASSSCCFAKNCLLDRKPGCCIKDNVFTNTMTVLSTLLQLITKLFPSQCNVYNKGPVGENVFHVAMLLNTPSTLAIAKYLVKLYGTTLVNTPYQVCEWNWIITSRSSRRTMPAHKYKPTLFLGAQI